MSIESTTPSREIEITLEPVHEGRRLDLVLAAVVEGTSRSVVQRWISEGLVTVDGRAAKASMPVAPGHVVRISIPAPVPSALAAEDLPLGVVYQDTHIAVIDKPAGMVVHPAAGHQSGTVVNALLHHVTDLSSAGGQQRPGIVHRLDKGTSGLMVIAKDDVSHRGLARQFQERTVTKNYQALVWGRPKRGLVLDSPLGRDPRHRQKISSRATKGRAAITTIVQVETLGEVSLVMLQIGTGRTHQIRVHLSEAGFPVVGDDLYGGRRTNVPARLASLSRLGRPFLHASHLEFLHPTSGKAMTFDAPMPDDLTRVLSALGHQRIESPR